MARSLNANGRSWLQNLEVSSMHCRGRAGPTCLVRRIDADDFYVEYQQRIGGNRGRRGHRIGKIRRYEHAPLRSAMHHPESLTPTRDHIAGSDDRRLAAAVAAVEFLAVEEAPTILHRDVIARA